jgi:phosphohistidine swiveling domain-containing protein
LVYSGYSDNKLWKKYGIDYSLKDLMQIDFNWIYTEEHMAKFAKWLSEKILKDKRFFQNLKNKSLFYEKKFLQSAKKGFKNFAEEFKTYSITIAIYFICDDLIEEYVNKKLSEKVSKEKVKELMHFLTLPLEDNFNIKEKLSALKNNYNEHIKEFGWMSSRYGKINPYTEDYYNNLRRSLKEEDYLVKYKEQKDNIKKSIIYAKELLGNEDHIIDVMQFFIFYRTQRTDIINKSLFFTKSMIEKEAKKIGLNYENFLYLDIKEIMSKNAPSKDIIRKRRNGFTAVGSNGKIKYYTGLEHEKYVNEYLKIDNCLNELKGRAAFIGMVKGTARVISSNNDLGKVQNGDILITYMTTPNMVPAMQKASAFVTDEGGITCHAAIVAREMKKPCVIGTKIATKVFKDGDLIEVDAVKGIVRKIK